MARGSGCRFLFRELGCWRVLLWVLTGITMHVLFRVFCLPCSFLRVWLGFLRFYLLVGGVLGGLWVTLNPKP